ncbi:MAG TPA: hypothetical protein HA314_02455, partial [Candidatus Thalassarchaeaceae archaeon]|nr:hypothetical protein [Candidatus Thalassarchaeaceae archaeon]
MSEHAVRNSGIFFAHKVARKSQFEMISDGIDTLTEGGFLLAAAPTGIGKTAA